jgi:hypothetical protein
MAYYTHARADNAGDSLTVLRQNPHTSSGWQRDSRGHRVVLQSPQKLNVDDVIEDDNDNDYLFVCVTTSWGEEQRGFIGRSHLVYTDAVASRMYRHLSDVDWWMHDWYLARAACFIVCTHSTEEVDAESIGETKDSACNIFKDGYTYVKLEVGRLWHPVRESQVCRSHHITLEEADRQCLQTDLQRLLD